MFLLIPPTFTLTTPLLKVPLLASYALGMYGGMTPPNPRPKQHEKDRVAKPLSGSLFTEYSRLHMGVLAATKIALCTLALGEAVSIVTQHTSFLPDDIHRFLRVKTLRLMPASIVGCLLAAIGGLTRVWCYKTLGRLFTFELSVRDDHKLVTSGPYAIVRHPSYTGWILGFGGTVMWLTSNGSYFVESGMWDTLLGKAAVGALVVWWSGYAMALVERAPLEDSLMHKEFGSQWEEWAKKTPYRLFPFIY